MISHKTVFDSNEPFLDRSKKIYDHQSQHCTVYKDFLRALGTHNKITFNPDTVPLLPIRAFKYRDVISGRVKEKLLFESSGTSKMNKSRHLIADPQIYQKAILKGFNEYFSYRKYSLICYMPGYQDQEASSLIYMARILTQNDPDQLSCFLPDSRTQTEICFQKIRDQGKRVLLFGAAFGLMDLIEEDRIPEGFEMEILETGGMKTYRREMSKNELRKHLSDGFGVDFNKIHSEYGMCELLSQMYAIGDEWFKTPDWVYVTIRDDQNPVKSCMAGEEGKIGVIDLANIHSCSFILTEDRGVMDDYGRFQVLGRWSSNNLRGCNFLVDS